MKIYERHEIFPHQLEAFMMNHVGESIIFREKHVELDCLDIVHEMSKAEYNMSILNILQHTDGLLNDEEKAAIEYAIECIKTLDDMGIIKEKENKDND